MGRLTAIKLSSLCTTHSLMQSWGTHLLAPPVGTGALPMVDVVGFATQEGGPDVTDGGSVEMVFEGADDMSVVLVIGGDEITRKEVPNAVEGGNVESATEDNEEGQREEVREAPSDGRLVVETSDVEDPSVVSVAEGDGRPGDDDSIEVSDAEKIDVSDSEKIGDEGDQEDGDGNGNGTGDRFEEPAKDPSVESDRKDVCEASPDIETDSLREDAGVEETNDSIVEPLF